MQTDPMIDVLIPVYNAGDTIESSIRSILNQTIKNIRIIVVDDGSTDNTGQVLRTLQDIDPRIDLISTANGGIVSALNIALDLSKAEFIARHDADDIAYEYRFERQLEYMAKHPDCVALGCNAVIINENDEAIRETDSYGGNMISDPGCIPAKEPYILHPFLMTRSSAIKAIGGYRSVLHAEDTDLYWRLLERGRLYNLPDILGKYRIHGNSVTSGTVRNGRIGAVYATLSAVSRQRVLRGASDLLFPADAMNRIKEYESLCQIIGFVSHQLTDSEMQYLQSASAAKLLQNATYRAYSLEKSDSLFIHNQLKVIRLAVSKAAWREIRVDLSVALFRLVKAGRLKEAIALQGSMLDYIPYLRFSWRRLKQRLYGKYPGSSNV